MIQKSDKSEENLPLVHSKHAYGKLNDNDDL